MNTFEFTCSHCGQTFAVAPQQHGQQVECPHCQQTITLQALEPQDLPERPDGIVFNPDERPEPAAPHADQPFAGFGAPSPAPAAADSAAQVSPLDFAAQPATQTAGTLPPPAELPVRPRGRSQLVPLLLVFLIPYSVVTTGVIAYLLWQQHERPHPLEMLLDQQPDDGGPKKVNPKQVKHDLPLPDKLKKPLKEPFQVGGFVEVTAQGVELSPIGDQLILTLKFRNISEDLQFNPMPKSFLVREKGYTFLEFDSNRIYGGDLSWKGRAGAPMDGILSPGEEMTATLSTLPQHAALVKKLANYRGPLLWRLEIRRGLVEVRGRPVSATLVLGIVFDSSIFPGRIEEARGHDPTLSTPMIAWALSATFPLRGGQIAAMAR
jgi:DNA-directed RNA polymerase subunit RPC12/RpoP